MRVKSLIVLVLIVGAVAYVAVFQREWLWSLFTSGRQMAAGYTAATTPEDAMDQFARAIKERDYVTAAVYCQGEYAEYLTKAHDAAVAIGGRVDQLTTLSKDRGIYTETAHYVLMTLDPFPSEFKRDDSFELKKQETDDDKEFYVGRFRAEPITIKPRIDNVKGLDPLMFRNALMPRVPGYVPAFNYHVQIVSDGADNKSWKLDIPLDNELRAKINHFLNNYKKYDNGLANLIDTVRPGSYDSPRAFEEEVIRVLAKQNK